MRDGKLDNIIDKEQEQERMHNELVKKEIDIMMKEKLEYLSSLNINEREIFDQAYYEHKKKFPDSKHFSKLSAELWMKEQRFKYQKNKVEEYRRSLVQDDNQKIEVKHPPSQIIKDKILETIRKYFDSSSIRY